MEKERQLGFQDINPDPRKRAEQIKAKPNPVILLLDGLNDPENLGAMFRLADAACIAGIFGYNMTLDSQHTKIKRISRDTVGHIPYKSLYSLNELNILLEKYQAVALEYTNKSIPFTEYRDTKPCMLVIGNEQRGVSDELLELCQTSIHIPMLGMNSSMNVSVATGIAVYHFLAVMGKI